MTMVLVVIRITQTIIIVIMINIVNNSLAIAAAAVAAPPAASLSSWSAYNCELEYRQILILLVRKGSRGEHEHKFSIRRKLLFTLADQPRHT